MVVGVIAILSAAVVEIGRTRGRRTGGRSHAIRVA
jgi:hypothetical protein